MNAVAPHALANFTVWSAILAAPLRGTGPLFLEAYLARKRSILLMGWDQEPLAATASSGRTSPLDLLREEADRKRMRVLKLHEDFSSLLDRGRVYCEPTAPSNG